MNKIDFLKAHERKLSLAFYFFWTNKLKTIKRNDIQKIVYDGYLGEEEKSKIEREYSLFSEKYLLPLLILCANDGERYINEKIEKGVVIDSDFKRNIAENAKEEYKNYYFNEQIKTINKSLGEFDVLDDRLYWEVVKASFVLNNKDLESLINYYKSMKEGGVTDKVRNFNISRHRESKIKYRASTASVTDASRAYSKMHRMSVDYARNKYNWGKMKKTWVTAEDERTCPICGSVHNMTIDYDSEFPVLGGIISPEESHVRCRCAMEVFRDE